MSTTIYMRPLGHLCALACQAHMSVALDGNNCCVASLEAKLPRRTVLSPFFPLPLIRPLTQTGVFCLLPLAGRRRIFFLAEQSKSRARGQECKRAAATMDSSSRRRSSPPLMLLPEDLIIRILLLHLEDRHGMMPSTRYAGLRHVCTMFRRTCDSPEVLRRLQLRGTR